LQPFIDEAREHQVIMSSTAVPIMAGVPEEVDYRDIVVVGASAGGVESLIAFAKAFEADLPATILVVLHVPASGASALPHILERFGNLPVDIAAPQQRLQRGRIVIAPPDRHLVVVDNELRTSHGPRGHPSQHRRSRRPIASSGPRVLAAPPPALTGACR
jgi:two-component system chemotaxis response regulator CheB